MEEKKISSRDEVRQRIMEKLNETKDAQAGAELPKGTAIEDEMIQAETPTEVVPEKKPEVIAEKKGRGRPRGSYKQKKTTKKKEKDGTTTETVSETEHETPPVEQTDLLTPMVNTVIVPIIARIAKKDIENLKITDEQSKEAVKLMPPDAQLFKPSWPAYITALVLAVTSNAIYAPKKSAETEELAEIKKALAKSLEVESLRKDILEMRKKMEEISASMYVVRDNQSRRNDGSQNNNSSFQEAVIIS